MIPTGSARLTPADEGSAERLAMSGPEWQFEGQIRAVVFPALHFRQHPVVAGRRWRFDFAWPNRRIAVEIDGGTWSGGRHVRGEGYERDCEKLNAAVLAGWRVLRFTTAMVEDGRAIEALEQLFADT